MKIVSLVSSCRKDGNTARIAAILENELISAGKLKNIEVKIERVVPGLLDIRMCLGCRACFNKGEDFCPLKDDLLSLRDKFVDADGIIAGSPVYVEDVNGAMKNLIDRLAFNCHRPGLTGKVVFFYTTSGAGSSNHSIRTMKTAFGTWGCHNIGSHRFRTGALMKTDDMEEKYGRVIKKTAGKLIHAISNGSSAKPSVFSLIAFTVQQACWLREGIDKNSVDYKYWYDNGWLEKGCKYYFRHGANPLKAGFSNLLGRIAALFFI